MFSVTYDIFCDECANWIGDGCCTKEAVKVYALRKGWKITYRTHLCPVCKVKGK